MVEKVFPIGVQRSWDRSISFGTVNSQKGRKSKLELTRYWMLVSYS